MEYSNNTFLIHVCMTKCRWCNSVCKCILYEYSEYVCVCVCRWSCTYLQLQILTDVAFKSDLLQFFFLFMCVCPSVWSLAGCVSVRVSSSRNRCRNFYYCRHRCYLCMSVNKHTHTVVVTISFGNLWVCVVALLYFWVSNRNYLHKSGSM